MISILERINLVEKERITGKLRGFCTQVVLEQILKDMRKSYLHKEPGGGGRDNYQRQNSTQRWWGETCLKSSRKNKEAKAAGLNDQSGRWNTRPATGWRHPKGLLTNGQTLTLAQSEMGSSLQSLRHRNDVSEDCFTKNTLAAVLRTGQRKGRAELLAQLKAVTAIEATDDGSSQGDCRRGGGGEQWLGSGNYKRKGTRQTVGWEQSGDSAKSLVWTTETWLPIH